MLYQYRRDNITQVKTLSNAAPVVSGNNPAPQEKILFNVVEISWDNIAHEKPNVSQEARDKIAQE